MINQRIFSANVGDSSVGNAGPDAIEQDIDNLLANDQELLGQINSLDAYAVASGTDTYTATIDGYTLVEGKSVKIKFTNANTSASTLNINSLGAKAIKKSNGDDLSSGNIKAGQICNLVYTGSVFQLLGEGGEYGTATASDVLQGKTIGTENGLVTGTMPNHGAVNETLVSNNQEYTIPSGYHNGLGKIKAVITGLAASVIKAGTTVGGILGTFTSDANAVAGDILSGKTAYKNGAKLTGTMPNRGAVSNTITTQGGSYTIPSGYHNGSGKVTASFSNLSAGNVKDGVNIGGIVGTLKPAPALSHTNIIASRISRDPNDDYIGLMVEKPSSSQMVIGDSYTNNSFLFIQYFTGVGHSSDRFTISVTSGTIYVMTSFSTSVVRITVTPSTPRTTPHSNFAILNPERVTVTIQYSEGKYNKDVYKGILIS